jgi:hypothetical protein
MPGQALASDHPKLIYFVERRAEMDADAFRDRWREHAHLGMSMPRWRNIQRYAHCDAIAFADSRLPIAWCDGVGIIWYRDETRRLNHVTDNSAVPVMKQDEREAFARPVREVALLADEFILLPCTDSRSKLFLRLWRQPTIERAKFRTWWLAEAGPELAQRLATIDSIRGYVQNHARLVEAENAPPSLCDCVDEIACEDTAACEAVLIQLFDELHGFADHISSFKAIWTSETILHGARC